jgi:hypothetical protein
VAVLFRRNPTRCDVSFGDFGAAEREQLGTGLAGHGFRNGEHEVGPRERGPHPAAKDGGALGRHEFRMAQRNEVVLHHTEPRSHRTGCINYSPELLAPRGIGKEQHIMAAERDAGTRR